MVVTKTEKIRSQVKNIIWGIKYLWALTPSLMAIIICTALFGSFLPAGLALATRSLINSISESIRSNSDSLEKVLPFLLITLVFVVLQNICTAASNYFTQLFKDNVNIKVSSTIMLHASKQDITFFEISDNQDMLALVQQNTSNHLSICFVGFIHLISDIIKLISLSVILILIEPLISIIILPIFIPYLIFKTQIVKDRYEMHHNRIIKRRRTNYFVSLLTHPEKVAEIRMLGIAQYLSRKFNVYMKEFYIQDCSLYKRSFIGNLIFSIISNMILFAILGRVIIRALVGVITIGDVVVFIGSSGHLRSLLENTTKLISSVHEHSLYIDNFRKFLNISQHNDLKQGDIPEITKGAIEVKNVSFTYPGAKLPTLNNISLQIQSGEIIAFVGENAAGKTTLAKLIAGLYKVESGKIIIDGHNLRDSAASHLQQKIAFVFQDVGKYEATVYENIVMGDWEQLKHDKAYIQKVAHDINIQDFIEKYPQGYETLLGRLFGTHNPSGGQWQNIAIARAFARNSAILILDEPTANLSASGEYELFKSFKILAKGRTTILISHRFSTVKIADRIVMLNEGHIIETGTHKELLSRKGAYAALFDLHQRQMDMENG